MLRLDFHNLNTLLCIGAHSDDLEIGCGGTVLRLLAENPRLKVDWVVLGATGRRNTEAVRSARRLLSGADEERITIKGFRDSYFPYIGGEVKAYFEELAAQDSPDLILTHHRQDLHQDHRLVSELTRCAFRDHLILEYEIPKYDGDLGRPNLYVPLDEPTCRRKVETILESFQSQHEKNWFSEDTFWALLRLRGVECRSPSEFAEAFYAYKLTV